MDGYIFVDNLLQMIQRKDLFHRPLNIVGHCTCDGRCEGGGAIVFRANGTRWYMPEAIWPQPYYPHYCYGYLTIMTPFTVRALLAQTTARPTPDEFWIDDVLFNGIYRARANVNMVNLVGAGAPSLHCNAAERALRRRERPGAARL